MRSQIYKVDKAMPEEFEAIGNLMVEVYAQLEGLPKQDEQPNYYRMFSRVDIWHSKPGAEILVVRSNAGEIQGAVIYFDDMEHYGSGGIASSEKNAAGFRLLAVQPSARGQGIAKRLVIECLSKAKKSKRAQVILHTTKSMQIAWSMYESLGFKRSADLDFKQETLEVFGFRLTL